MSSVKHCSHCEGTGYEMLEDERVYCPTCNGRGWVTDDGPNEYAKAGHAFTGDAQRFDAERRSASASDDVVEQQDADASAPFTPGDEAWHRVKVAEVRDDGRVRLEFRCAVGVCDVHIVQPTDLRRASASPAPDLSVPPIRFTVQGIWAVTIPAETYDRLVAASGAPACTCRGYDDAPSCPLHGKGMPASAPDARDGWATSKDSPACSKCEVEPATHCARCVAAAEVHARRMGQLDQIGQQVEGIGRALDSREQCGESADLETAGAVYRNGVRDGRREAIEACAALVETLPSMGLREVAARLRSDPFTFATAKKEEGGVMREKVEGDSWTMHHGDCLTADSLDDASAHVVHLVADQIRASCPDPTPHANPLVDLWRHEFDVGVKSALRMLAVHGPEHLVVEAAAAALARGCTPSVVAEALEACIPIYATRE